MYLETIQLINYKNFASEYFNFDAKINCLVGNNGVGKTNVLDAIYHLSQTKSYFNPVTVQNIKHGEEFFVIDGKFISDEKQESIVCSYKRGKKKIIKRNGKIFERFSEHIGNIPIVIISPADRDLIIEGSETRRRFMDHVISQSDKGYLQDLISYTKVLAQRNALLKYFAKNRTFNADSLAVYDKQLSFYSKPIFEKRLDFINKLKPIFNKHYSDISNLKENTNIQYKSHLQEESLEDLLVQNAERDRVLQYTSKGIHRDDISFFIDTYPIKKFGSQGQQKSFLIALKLAQFDLIKELSKRTPILLLDDIFDKLDDDRVIKLIDMVHKEHFGQIFISDTHFERTEKVVQNTNQSYKIFKL
ncbi:MAG TPA: DNA replication and repair protein RecF [Lutibacter sp.]|nr:DNA replication and repair protein RecF [Lutibacter sp.]